MSKIKALWLCAEGLDPQARASASGHWKDTLYQEISKLPGLNTTVAAPGRSFGLVGECNAFRYPRKRGDLRLPQQTIDDICRLIRVEAPDLIHLHGTETTLGQITQHTAVPVVISLQGFISECIDAVLGGIALSTWHRYRSIREVITGGGVLGVHADWKVSSAAEISVIATNRHFIGRTAFDREVVRKHNASANYYYGRELLRKVFRNGASDALAAEPQRIYCPGFSNPLKGFHVLLNAVSCLKQEFPRITIATPGQITPKDRSVLFGNSYHRMLWKMLKDTGLHGRVHFLGRLDGKAVRRELLKANIFVAPSFMENSSNALGEALALGCPAIIANPCGGQQSIGGAGRGAIEFSCGDPRSLADTIRSLLLDSQLAQSLSEAGRRRAREVHGPDGVAEEYETIYRTVISG